MTMTTIPAAQFPHGASCRAPWNRPGLRPEKAWLCGQAWEAELAHEDLVLAHGPSVRERTLVLDAGEQGWLVALMPKPAAAPGGPMSAHRSTAWAAEPGITTTPLPRMQVRWRQSRWEAYCPICERVVGYSGDRHRATREGLEHATCRCPQRLADRGLCPCRSCDGWGCVDLGGGHLARCDSCQGACTESLR